jgi:hypothetical protein
MKTLLMSVLLVGSLAAPSAAAPVQPMSHSALEGVALAIAYDHQCTPLSTKIDRQVAETMGVLTANEYDQVLRLVVDWETRYENDRPTFCAAAKIVLSDLEKRL